MIGRTLFWYVFKDLLKIFFMASGALAGIMSFGGLLRPLTREGLDAGQVVKVLNYFMPAMTTYSLPVAALFATTVVYGRLSADNELTGCQAGGVGHSAIALPAFVLGIFVAFVSLLFLCFIVPTYTLKVEKVLYSNLAKMVAGRIERNHYIPFGQASVYASKAVVTPGEFLEPGQQQVVLEGPTIQTFDRPNKEDRSFRVPKEFLTANQAIIDIEQNTQDGSEVNMTVRLQDGFEFPRKFQGATQAGIQTTEYGPIRFPSPIKEDTKFMDVWRLQELYHDPMLGRDVRELVRNYVHRDQEAAFATRVVSDLNGQGYTIFEFGPNERYLISRDASGPLAVRDGQDARIPARLDASTPDPLRVTRPITFRREVVGQATPTVHAAEAELRVRTSSEPGQMRLTLKLIDAASESGQGTVERKNFAQAFTVPIPADLIAFEQSHNIAYYLVAGSADRERLAHELVKLSNNILAESNSRASFAISCLILVMVGCSLGMMFRSGNFLTAFAVSFVPALLTITLIIAGQRTAANVPTTVQQLGMNAPLQLGLCLIWSGNIANFIIASTLLWRLHRK